MGTEIATTEITGAARRFHVELLIIHPELTPQAITAEIGLAAHRSHAVGNPRMTPKGTPLPEHYPDTRWRHSVEHTIDGQWFIGAVAAFLDKLKPCKAFLHRVRVDGGSACLCIQFFDGPFGDEIPRELLATLVDLDLDLGIEVF